MSEILKKHLKQVIEISDNEYSDILPLFKTMRFRKRQFVIQEHQQVSSIYFVEKGLLKSSYVDNSGKEHILQFASNQWWVSDFDAFFRQGTSKIAVDCIEDSHLLALTYKDLEEICKNHSKIEHFFRVKSNFGYVALQQRILSLLSESAKERFDNFKNQYPTLVNKIPKQLIAQYLGVTRETLSRL